MPLRRVASEARRRTVRDVPREGPHRASRHPISGESTLFAAIIQGFASASKISVGTKIMPIYAYRCESCGFAKDVLQKMSDAPLTQCPECGKDAFRKQVTAAGFQLKGSGWYVTDFRGGNGSNGSNKEADSGSNASGDKSNGEGSSAGVSSEGGKSGSSDSAAASSSKPAATPAGGSNGGSSSGAASGSASGSSSGSAKSSGSASSS